MRRGCVGIVKKSKSVFGHCKKKKKSRVELGCVEANITSWCRRLRGVWKRYLESSNTAKATDKQTSPWGGLPAVYQSGWIALDSL